MSGKGKSWRRNDSFRRWDDDELEVTFPKVAYPKDHRFSVKQIAYMHVYCRDEVRDIVSRYPRTLTMSHVHFALGHYFSNKEAIDEEIKRDLEFDRRRSLDAHSMTLPTMRDAALIEEFKTAK